MPVELWNVSNSAYHADQETESATTMKLLRDDPLTYYRARVSKEIPMPQLSPGTGNLGSAFEIKLFEPHLYDKLVVVTEHGYKSAGFKKFVASLGPDMVAISEGDADKVPSMLAAVMAEPKCKALLDAPGQCQVSVRGTLGRVTGIQFKARFDKLLDDGRTVQLKTTNRITREEFGKQCSDLNYHIAEALYRLARDEARTSKAVNIGAANENEMIVVQNEEPFEAFNYFLDEPSMSLGKAELEECVRKLVAYRKLPAGVPWYREGHGERVSVSLPPWRLPRIG